MYLGRYDEISWVAMAEGLHASGVAECSSDESDKREKLLEPLLRSARASMPGADAIENLLLQPQRLPNGIETAQILDLVRLLRSSTNRDYRNLVGMLNFLRHEDYSPSLEQALQRILQSDLVSDHLRSTCKLLKEIHDKGFDHHSRRNSIVDPGEGIALVNAGAQWDKEFADRTLRLVRALYPLGINMRNPDLSEREPLGVDARQIIVVLMPGHRDRCRIEIHPDGECSCVVHSVKGDKFEPEFSPLTLRDGQSIRVGRSLTFERDIYGLAVPRGGISIPVQACIEDDRTSRGGLLVLRQQGVVYLFDCGSRHEVTFSFERGEWTRYEPSPRLSEGGYDTGRSGVYRRRIDDAS